MRFAARPRTPSLRELCVELSDKVQMQGQLLQLATRPNETALLERMSRLSPADREFLLTLLNFDADARQALVAAARSPEITRLVVNRRSKSDRPRRHADRRPQSGHRHRGTDGHQRNGGRWLDRTESSWRAGAP